MADSKLLNPSNPTSPPPNCAICLGSCSNKCFSDTCRHQFCFKCLLQWSKIKAECPLCKQPFKSIIHNVKSNEEYEEHIVEEPIHIIDNEQYLYLPQSPPRQHRFHFRTTFTVNTHGENAIQQMLLSHSLTNGISISNYMPGSWPHYSRRSRRDITTTTSFRRSIYNSNLWASATVDVTGVYREVTPEYFQANPASRTRLAPWLNRELNALLYENTQDVMQLVDTIMDYLLRYHICSRAFRNLLQTYLGERTDHFVHEFYNFMRSPYDMIGYDRHVIYMERPTSPTPYIDISEDDSSDVMIVEEHPDIIEVSSNDSDDSDVIMTSFPTEIPKPQLLPVRPPKRRRLEVPLSSSSDREQRREGRSRHRKKKKNSFGEKSSTKRKQFKMADFVMDDSSSSELDDLPLAKYIRIKASIDKRILKKSSHLNKRKSYNKKSRSYRKNISNKKSSSCRNRKFMPKLIDIPSSTQSKPHCSKYVSRRRNTSSSSTISSSSSSSDSSSSTTSRTLSRSSSSQTCTETRHKSKNNMHSSNTFTSQMETSQEQRKETVSPQSLDLSLSSCRSTMNGTLNTSEESFFQTKEDISLKERKPQNFCNYPMYSTENVFSEGPSTSGLRDRTKLKTSRREHESLKAESRISNHFEQDLNIVKQALELTNHCRYSPLKVNPYVSVEQSQGTSTPTLLSISPNQSRIRGNPSPTINFYNSSQSPELIDLSISKTKNDPMLTDPCLPYKTSSNFQTEFQKKSSESRDRFGPPDSYSWPSTSQHCSSSQAYYANPRLPKQEPKTEPIYPEYYTEGLSRYWTDFAVQNPALTNPNDSAGYSFSGACLRKSVIQNLSDNSNFTKINLSGNRDYPLSYNSPKWSSSNSPTYSRNMERWSENSD